MRRGSGFLPPVRDGTEKGKRDDEGKRGSPEQQLIRRPPPLPLYPIS